MPEDKINRGRDEEMIQFPDIIELWKKIYFSTEEAYTNIGKEFVGSNAFVSILGQIRDQYLSQHKITTQIFDQYLTINPLASKKDIARVAELIIALEDKQDKFDLQFSDNLASIADSLLRLVTLQQSAKSEALLLKQDISNLNEKLDHVNVLLQNLQSGKMKDPVNKKKTKDANIDERRDSHD